jgi:hypothetical protein
VLNLTDGLGRGNVGGQEGGGDAHDDAHSAAGGTPQQEGPMISWPNKAGMTGVLHGGCQFDTMTSCAVITSTWNSILSKLPPNAAITRCCEPAATNHVPKLSYLCNSLSLLLT